MQPVTIASDSGKRSKICNNMIEILAENIKRKEGDENYEDIEENRRDSPCNNRNILLYLL